MRTSAWVLVLSFLCVGCPAAEGEGASSRAPAPAPQASEPPPPSRPSPAPAARTVERPASAPGPEIVLAAQAGGTVQEQVRAALRTAEGDDRRLVVYVGATWCEPCKRFHDAVVAGQLDAQLAQVRFLEFDHDVHHDGLKAAGYLRRFVPLFAIPKADGSASDRVHHGAIKGPGAVDFILPHLKALLEP